MTKKVLFMTNTVDKESWLSWELILVEKNEVIAETMARNVT